LSTRAISRTDWAALLTSARERMILLLPGLVDALDEDGDAGAVHPGDLPEVDDDDLVALPDGELDLLQKDGRGMDVDLAPHVDPLAADVVGGGFELDLALVVLLGHGRLVEHRPPLPLYGVRERPSAECRWRSVCAPRGDVKDGSELRRSSIPPRRAVRTGPLFPPPVSENFHDPGGAGARHRRLERAEARG
jgi:hypothetical protein